jgi:phosphomannomutase
VHIVFTYALLINDVNLNSDIRGVALDGVEGEDVNLTEPVAEAIGAAFAGWLVEKKKADASQHLRVSIGHDSRISAKLLQV